MNDAEFFEQFGHLAAAPYGIARLRRLILDLAVRGRLVPQDPSDEPAPVLLERIAGERERLIAVGEVKKGKPILPVDAEAALRRLPDGWGVARLGGICMPSQYGWTTSAAPTGAVRLLRTTDMSSGAVDWDLVPFCKEPPNDEEKYLLAEGDILVSRAGSIGIGAVLRADPPSPSVFASYLIRFRMIPGGVRHGYIGKFLQSSDYWRQIGAQSAGTALANINAVKLSTVTVPIPPAAEQSRIVERVEELSGFCDELEEEQFRAKALRAATARSSLSALAESDTADAEQALSIIKNHLRLSLRPGDGASEVVTEIRKAILDLAVRGRLVPQDPSDEPAPVLLERIAGERERLIAEKKVRRGKPLPSIETAGAPYEVPSGWAWARMASVVEHRLGKMLDASRNTGELRPYLRGVNVRWGGIDLSDVKQMRIEERDLAEYSLRDGDILVCEGGEAGRCAIWDQPDTEMYFQKALHRLRPLGGIEPTFVLLSLSAAHQDGRIERRLTGTTIKHLPGEKIALVEIALPPLHEQRRIAERVAELLALCDDLEMRLCGERRLATEMADSVVSSLVA